MRRWTERAARMRETMNTLKSLVGKSEGLKMITKVSELFNAWSSASLERNIRGKVKFDSFN